VQKSPGRRIPSKRRASERGAALVEMALVLPIIMMVLFGVIEFGATYNNFISLRDGTRNAARSASVGNFGTTTSCDLTGAGEASTNVQRLMCLTKEQIGLDTSKLRVKVLSADSTFAGAGTFAKNEGIIVCAQIPTTALTGFLSTALTGKTLRTKVAMRIERSDITATAGDETAPTGRDWSWCTYSAYSP
jgi:Flp pilus assembly protein TadG